MVPFSRKAKIICKTNSRGLRLLRKKIADVRRMTIGDTDHGQGIRQEIIGLNKLLQAYQDGTIQPKS